MSDRAEFIKKHAKPYDPDTDIYRRPPFAQPVKAGKNSPIYNAHSYHTNTPGNWPVTLTFRRPTMHTTWRWPKRYNWICWKAIRLIPWESEAKL